LFSFLPPNFNVSFLNNFNLEVITFMARKLFIEVANYHFIKGIKRER